MDEGSVMKICNGMILGLLVSSVTFAMEKEEQNKPQQKNQSQQEYGSRALVMQLMAYEDERESISAMGEGEITPRTKMAALIELDSAIKDLQTKMPMNSAQGKK